ncbi:MAG: hypothetical protein RLZZ152_2368, partial [Pseudomonadota bacterium]
MALASSLLIAFTIVPALASLALQPEGGHEPVVMQKIHVAYVRLRDFIWRKPKWLYLASLVSLILAAVLYSLVGKTFMPTMDEGDLIIGVEKLLWLEGETQSSP